MKENTRHKSLSTQAMWYFSGNVASYFVIFLIPVILVRIFSKDDYGNYAQLILIYDFFFRVLQFGFRSSLYYFLPKYNQYKRYFITNTYIFFSIAGVLILLLLIIFKANIAQLFNASNLTSLLSLCGLHIIFMLIACPFEPILIIESKAEKAALVAFLSQALRGIFIISFVLILKTVLSAIIGLLCYSFLRFLAYSIFIYKRFGIVIDKNNINHLKHQIRYAAPMGFSGFIESTSRRLDKFILAAFFSPEVFAVYTVGNFRIPFIHMFFNSVTEVAVPRAVELLKANKVREFLELWRKIIIRLSFVGIGSFFLLQIIAHDLIILIFTDKYESSVMVFRIILLIFFGQMVMHGVILRALGYTKDIFKSYLFAFILLIPLTFLLVKYLGLIGAAISAVFFSYINAISQLFFSVKRLDKKVTEVFPFSTLLKIGIICFILAAILFNVQNFLHFKVLRILMSGGIFSILYLYISYKTEVFNIFEEKLFKKIFHRFSFVKTQV